MHARIDESFTLVYDAIVTRSGAVSALPAAVATGVAVTAPVQAPAVEEPADDASILHDNLAAGAGVLRHWANGHRTPMRPCTTGCR